MRPQIWTAVAAGGLWAVACGYGGSGDGCKSHDECDEGYTCVTSTGRCRVVEPASSGADFGCDSPNECFDGETCGTDRTCHPGSCYFHECVNGYDCVVVEGVFTCAAEGWDAGPASRDASPD